MKPTRNEIICIEYARNYYPQPQLTWWDKLLGRKEDIFNAEEQDVSELKTFTQLWSDFGLRDFGIEYLHRGRFDRNDKLACIKMWVKILYKNKIDIDELQKKIIERNNLSRRNMATKNPGLRFSYPDVIDSIPTEIDKLVPQYGA